jgi:hypothetical protein
MLIVEVEGGQLPLLTVHINLLTPGFSAVTCDEALPVATMLPEPETSDHWPVPEEGAVALRVAVEAHRDWLLPALAVEGSCVTVIVTMGLEETFVLQDPLA